MNLSESLKHVRNLAEAMPAILELSGPLEKMESLQALDGKIESMNMELTRLESMMANAKQETSDAMALAESSKKAASDMAGSISDKAFEESKPRREANEQKMKDAEMCLQEAMATLNSMNAAVESKKKEFSDLEQKISSVKAEAAKALGI